MKRRIGTLCVGLAVWLGAAGGAQGAGTTGAEFLQMQVAADSAALAAGTADTREGATLAGNPAGILGAGSPVLSLTHFASLADTAYEQIEGIYPDALQGHVGLRVFYSGNYDLKEVDEAGNEAGRLRNYNALGQVSYARRVWDGCDGGLSVKVFESALGGFTSRGVAFDAGARQVLGTLPVALGASVQNLGTMSAFDQEADPLPAMASVGVCAWGRVWEGQTVKALVDWNLPLAGEEKAYAVLGAEYSVGNLAFVRAGYRLDQELGAYSLGGGLRWAGLGLDYAFQPMGSLGSNHRLTVSYYFKPSAPHVSE